MKILMLEKCLEVGGVETYLKTLTDGLIKKGHSVTLITMADDSNEENIEQFKKRGVTVLTIPYHKNRGVAFFYFFKKIRHLLIKTHIDLIHSQHRLTHFTAIAAGKIWRIPRLLTLHMFKEDNKLLTSLWKNEPLTVPSKALKKHMLDYYGLKDERVQVIYNAVNPRFELSSNIVSRLKKNIFTGPDLFYVSYVGRLSFEKGVDILIESIPLVKEKEPDIVFRIFGNGPELNRLKKQCKQNNLDPNGIFYGPNFNINELLSLTDLSVLPSRAENFSLFALESLRAGTPMIASNVGGMPELIGDRKTGLLIEPENPKILAENILKLYHNEEMRKQFSREGRDRLTDKFSIDKFHQAHIQKYRDLCKTDIGS